MSILSAQSIERLCTNPRVEEGLIHPYSPRGVSNGRSYGLSSAGYDIRLDLVDAPGFKQYFKCRMGAGDFYLASSIERVKMPNNVIAFVKDKSSWARAGLCVQNTVLEPGWEGYITLELSFHRPTHHITLEQGDPIAQVVFQWLDEPTKQPYVGKYQNQEARPVEAILEAGPPYRGCAICGYPHPPDGMCI